MKCEKCGHLVREGYEYPEYYCELGIADNPKYEKYDTGDGCTVPKKKRIEICKELNGNEHAHGLWWDESGVKDEAMQVENMKISYFPHSTLIKNIYGECPMCHSIQSEDNFCANCGQRLSFKIDTTDNN